MEITISLLRGGRAQPRQSLASRQWSYYDEKSRFFPDCENFLFGCRYECFGQPRGDLCSVASHVDMIIFLRGALGNDATSIEPHPSSILIR